VTRPEGGFWASPDYEFVRLLGRGGTGWVALARHLPLDRLVAVKTMFGGGLDTAAASRVRREGRVLAALDRPTIVTVYQLIAGPDQLSLVMEYLPGGDFEQALKRGLPMAERAAVLDQVADALTAAAAVGVVHRDVKPGNVLLEEPSGRGRAVLADFGLARLPGAATEFRTAAGTVTGTPLYMAPEQFEHPEVESPAIDAYAFGVMAYLGLGGRHPFSGATVRELFVAHRDARPASLTELVSGIPGSVADAVEGALAKDPGRRVTPTELASVLRGVSSQEWARVEAGMVTRAAAHGARDDVNAGTRADASAPSQTPSRSASGLLGVTATGTRPGLTSLTENGTQAELPSLTASVAESGPGPTPSSTRPMSRSLPGQPSIADAGTGLERPRPSESWVDPPVYAVPPVRRRSPWPGLLVGAVIGVLGGVLVYFLLLRG
jgi:serine/threonine protein kinase